MANLITNINQACGDLANIKTAITDAGITITPGTPTSDYAEKVSEVYEAGKEAEYNSFWDNVQNKGERLDYTMGFAGGSWNDETFNPKYDMRPSWAIVAMFNYSKITDLEAILKRNNVVLDTSNNYNFNETFHGGAFTVLPEIVFGRYTGNTYSCFANNPNLHTIRKIVFSEEIGESTHYTTAFYGCPSLANIEFEGVLKGSIDLQECPLTKATIESLISVLSNDVTGKTVTLKSDAVNAAMPWDVWDELIATKPNWTFSLV